jgi:hypothetical protein
MGYERLVLGHRDPPYPHGTRTAKKVYGPFEMSGAGHERLLNVLLRCKGKVMLSSFPNALYDEALAGWRRVEFDVANRAAGGESKRAPEKRAGKARRTVDPRSSARTRPAGVRSCRGQVRRRSEGGRAPDVEAAPGGVGGTARQAPVAAAGRQENPEAPPE